MSVSQSRIRNQIEARKSGGNQEKYRHDDGDQKWNFETRRNLKGSETPGIDVNFNPHEPYRNVLQEYMMYKNFLHKLTPIEWREEKKTARQEKKKPKVIEPRDTTAEFQVSKYF